MCKREVGRLNSNGSVIEKRTFVHLRPSWSKRSSEEDALGERPGYFDIAGTRSWLSFLVWVLVLIALHATSHAVNPAELQKPPPDAIVPSHERVTVLIKERYPQLLLGHLSGTPVLTVLVNADGTIARSDLEISQQSAGTLTVTELQFARYGLRSGELQSVGVEREQLPHGAVLIVFGTRSSIELDRALVERYFPKAMTEPVPAGEDLWILFDHSGHVLKFGEEILPSADLKETIEQRYRGVLISAITVSSVIARDGRQIEDTAQVPLHLDCVWLASNSPSPSEP